LADNSHSYPSGIYGPGNGPPDEAALNDQEKAGNDPSWLSGPYMEMSEWWQPIKVCVGGTQAFRENAGTLLPIEPREDSAAWGRRTSHAVLSPFLTRIADQAAGLVMRKPITLKPKQADGVVDEYWEAWKENIDGYGTSIDSFARRVVLNSILYGHSAILCDYPSTEPAPNLRAEREMGLRPTLIEIRPDQILGWRKSADTPLAPIDQIRINEYVQENLGLFGDRVVRQIRILEPGKWSVWRKGEDGWALYQEGVTSLPVIPLAVTYSNKLGELMSKPPLLPIANLNILHAQRTTDQGFALHVAAMPILVLAGWDDNGEEIALSANAALVMSPDSKAYYVEPASQCFESQQQFITQIESQMQNLGLSTLFNQTYAAETAESKSLSRTDSDSMLAVVSKDLQKCLQNAFEMAAAYIGIEAPEVMLDHDFDTQLLDPQQVTQYMSLWTNGAIQHATLLEALKRGEILPSLEVQEEIEAIASEQLSGLDAQAAGGVFAGDEEEESSPVAEEEDSEVRKEVIRRMKKLAEDEEDESDD
jgi:hypothetical protein